MQRTCLLGQQLVDLLLPLFSGLMQHPEQACSMLLACPTAAAGWGVWPRFARWVAEASTC